MPYWLVCPVSATKSAIVVSPPAPPGQPAQATHGALLFRRRLREAKLVLLSAQCRRGRAERLEQPFNFGAHGAVLSLQTSIGKAHGPTLLERGLSGLIGEKGDAPPLKG